MAVLELFDRAEKGVKKDFLSGKEKERALVRIAALRKRYEGLGAIDEAGGVAAGLLERSNKLLGTSPLTPAALDRFCRHAGAAWYDLSGKLEPYAWYVRCFFVATIGLFVFAPQFGMVMLAIIFIVPTFLGLRGLKVRSVNGFTLSAMNFPMGLLSASFAARFFVPALFTGLGETAAKLASDFAPLPQGAAAVLVVVFALLSVLTIVASVAGAIIGFKHKDMFV